MKSLEKYIDHTLLKPEATTTQIKQLCSEAIIHNFYSVCVNSSFVSLVCDELKESNIKVTVVCGFPLGSMSSEAKSYEAQIACDSGADEIDMVIHIGKLKEGAYEYVKDDIRQVASVVHDYGGVLKVILETSLLTPDEKIKACEIAMEAGADFVKTSTGFASGGATISDVKLMKQVVGDRCMIKASGGIKDKKTAIAMIEAGADRLGVSASIEIVAD